MDSLISVLAAQPAWVIFGWGLAYFALRAWERYLDTKAHGVASQAHVAHMDALARFPVGQAPPPPPPPPPERRGLLGPLLVLLILISATLAHTAAVVYVARRDQRLRPIGDFAVDLRPRGLPAPGVIDVQD